MTMVCQQCGKTIPDSSASCPHCETEAAQNEQNVVPAAAPEISQAHSAPPKDKTTYILLGAIAGFFCMPGIHNLYIGNTSIGLIQLLCSVLSCGLLWIPMYIWTIVEICTNTVDSTGQPLR